MATSISNVFNPFDGISVPPAQAKYIDPFAGLSGNNVPIVDNTPAVNPAGVSGRAQVWNPAKLWNDNASNIDLGFDIPVDATNFAAGWGKAVSDIGTGAKQRFTESASKPNNQTLSTLITGNQQSEVGKLRSQVAEQRKLDSALMDTGYGKAGHFIGTGVTLAPTAFIPGVNTYTGAAVLGAGMGALSPSESNEETLVNTGIGAAGGFIGQGIGKGIGNLVSVLRGLKSKTNLSKGQKDAIQTANDLGFKTLPSQKTGSRELAQIEAQLEAHPESSGPFNAVAQSNRDRFNEITANAIGEHGSDLSSPVLGAAKDRLGKVFESVATKDPVPLDGNSVVSHLAGLEKEFEGTFANRATLTDNPLVERYLNLAAGGTATREQLRSISSNLGKAAHNAMTSNGGDRAMGNALFQVQDEIDNQILKSLSGDQRTEFSQALQQYRTLKQITSRTNVINPASGDVNPRALASALMSKDKNGYTFGSNDSDLYKAVKFVQAYPKLVNDSGTATKTAISVGQLPAKAMGAIISRLYMGMGNAAAKAPNSYRLAPGFATTDPLAQEIARLLSNPNVNNRAGTLLGVSAGMMPKSVDATQ
jgi:hypothetical protein